MEMQSLDFAASNEQAGFRLQRMEVFNWGTFHDRVWSLTPEGDNSLLTGDIGSGKSTLVDAITTLLVPAQRITYNKAAGADTRERSLKSYVLGYYKSERAETGLSARSVALRDHNNYSVVLGYFYNAGYDQHVTLAQVFWMKDSAGQPARFYVVADGALSIADEFAGFGSDITTLRKRLRGRERIEVFDSFPPYGAAFRRRFGIDGEQAMELFNQTVSMKTVDNITRFVREHMLEAFPVEERINALIGHFDDLNRAHEAVLRARERIASLEPLIADVDQYRDREKRATELRACREALEPWFAERRMELLTERREKLHAERDQLAARLEKLEERRRQQQSRRDELKQAIAENGGDRLERIKTEIRDRQEQKRERRQRAEQYRQLAETLDLPDAVDAETFLANQRIIGDERQRAEEQDATLQNRVNERGAALHRLREEHQQLAEEMESLRQRRSNIPARILAIRERLCEALELDEGDLPFAGELIQVAPEETDWEGAAERLLHNFGLSLLVPEERYRKLADWVERTHLRGRLVYYRVREPSSPAPQTQPDSLVRKLQIRPDSEFYGWLEKELAHRFDYVCCDDMERFRREKRAITPAGQIKAAGERHEKDDRHRIDDRSRYVLGWSNEAKIRALEKQAGDREQRMQVLSDEIASWQREQKALRERRERLGRLEMFGEFRELDWRPLASEIERLEGEHRELEAESEVLRTLERQLDETEQSLAHTEQTLSKTSSRQGSNEEKIQSVDNALEECQRELDETGEETRQCFAALEAMRTEALGERDITVENAAARQREMREWLQGRIDVEDKQLRTLSERIIRAMQAHNNAWPLESREVDASLDSAEDYRAMLEELRADDLPRFEERFKELLNENTIHEVAGFQGQLHRERQAIRERIEIINRSLRAIDYNPGRYITLLAEPTTDPDVRDFQQQLRACTEGTLTGSGDDQYSEQKFLQVKEIIERFRGREGQSEMDRRWTRKVTDVRNWFVFSASERWKEDDTEYEHYSDSGGKSGGQKEKLAYTVLAASLAYQFGLEWNEQRSRSFRFVVIDEAFGRGSDESARYGLELFRRLNLQLLIVTPLQKIHIIEPYVSSVGFVHSHDGRQSMVRNLTIEEYQAEKAARNRVALEQ